MSKIPLYLTGEGTIKREQNTIAIRVKDERPIYKPLSGVLSIYNYGMYQWNTSLLSFLDDNYIPMHVFTRTGMYRGTFYNPPIPSSEVFIRQIEFFFSRSHLVSFQQKIKTAYRESKALVGECCTHLSSPHEKTILSVFKGLMYASLIDGIYMTHLDPTGMASSSDHGMPLVYSVFGLFIPSVWDIYLTYMDTYSYRASDFYRCQVGMCLRSSKLKHILSFWEKIASSPVSRPRNMPRRGLLRVEFYKIERLIMWGKEYEPFVGLWGKV